jgi:hypothetical protein
VPTADLLPAAAVLLALAIVGVLAAVVVVLGRALAAALLLVIPADTHMVSTGHWLLQKQRAEVDGSDVEASHHPG